MSQLDDAIAKAASDASANSSVIDSAVIVLNGIQAQIDAAVAAALAAGATPAELASVTAVSDALEANTAKLAAAIPANTTPQARK